MAPSQLGIFTRSDPHRERANIQFHVQPLSLDKFGDPLHRFPAITVSACNLQPTSRGTVRIRSAQPDRGALDRAELSVDRRRSPGRRRCHPHHAAADEAAGARALSARGISAGPVGRRRRCLAGEGRRRYRHHDLPSRRHREDGNGQRSHGRGRRAPAFLRDRRTARGRCLGHADDHLGQYQYADRDDRRERRNDDSRGCGADPRKKSSRAGLPYASDVNHKRGRRDLRKQESGRPDARRTCARRCRPASCRATRSRREPCGWTRSPGRTRSRSSCNLLR